MQTVAELINGVVEATYWLKSIRISTEGTRLEQIHDYLQGIIDGSDPKSLMPDAESYALMADARAFNLISREFRKVKRLPIRTFKDALRKAPLQASHEDSTNNDPRNKLFELELAADLLQSGVDVQDFDDVRFKFEGHTYVIECKRPLHDWNFETSLGKAYEQLGERLLNPGDRGIVAFALEGAFNFKDSTQSVIGGKAASSFSTEQSEGLKQRIVDYGQFIVDSGKSPNERIVGAFLLFRLNAEPQQKGIGDFRSHVLMLPFRYRGVIGEDEERSQRFIAVVGKAFREAKAKTEQIDRW